jgi:protease I
MANMPKDTYQPETINRNAPRTILILTANNTEDLEFFYPYYRFIEAGYKVDVATPDGESFKGKQGLGLKESRKIADIKADDYELLYVPGGKAPAELKKNSGALQLVKQFVSQNKLIAAICHGPQLLAAAGVIDGHKISAWPEIEDEVREAGATYVNKETVIDGKFITARWPGDLPAHMKTTLAILATAGSGIKAAA